MCRPDGHVLRKAQLQAPIASGPLNLSVSRFRILMAALGPSLGLWRGAETAALREVDLQRPVLDVGCGDGLVSSLALWTVDIGLDPRADAAGRAAKTGVYERLIQAKIEDADLPDESMASVVSNSVIEHVKSPQAMLGAVSRVLKPGGLFAYTCPTPNFSNWLAIPCLKYARWRNESLEHLNLLSCEEWSDHLEKVGLSVIRIRPYLKRSLVFAWDIMELLQLIRIRKRAVFSRIWKKSPSLLLDCIALTASRLDLSSPEPGGGQLILALKR